MRRFCNFTFLCSFVPIITCLGGSSHTIAAEKQQQVALGPGVHIRNVDNPFDYFTNSWTVVGLKDHADGTRIAPNGELILAGGLRCRPLVGEAMVALNQHVKKTLRNGDLPIVRFDFVVNEAIRYTLEVFACPLGFESDGGYDWPTDENFLNFMRATLTNLKSQPAEAHFGLEWQPEKDGLNCEIRKTSSEKNPAVFSGETLFAVFRLPQEGVQLAAGGSRVRVSAALPAGGTAP